MFRLNRKGKVSQSTQSVLKELNDWLDTQDDATKYRYSQRQYNTTAELEDVYQEIFGKSANATGVEEANVVSESKEPISSSVKSGLSDEIPADFGFDPNSADVIEREYNKNTVDNTMQTTIGEPTYSAEEINMNQQGAAGQGASGSTETSQPKETKEEPTSTFANPQLTEADEKTKRLAAEQMADTFLELYGNAHTWVKPMAKIKDKTIIELEAKGIIDPELTVPIDENGTQVNARQFMQITNAGIDGVLTPDPTFNAKVKPPLVRELMKRNLGMTDMQYLMITFAQDIATKGAMIVGLRKQNNEILTMFKQMHQEKMEEIRGQKVTAVTPDSITYSAPANDSVLDDQTAFQTHEEHEEVI
jgi:hypothetical protein